MKFTPSAPRRTASSSSGWQMNGVTHAISAFTASPIGTPSARERRVVVVDPVLRLLGVEEREPERADAVLRREVDRLAPAARHPHRRVRPLERLRHDVARRHRHVLAHVPGERVSVRHRSATRSPPPTSRASSSGSIPNASSSIADDDSPVPNSTRPPERTSSVAMRSATRAGWLIAGGVCTIPWPRRIRFVRCDSAPRNTSGALEWRVLLEEVVLDEPDASMPSRSASSICSSASSNTRRSSPSSHGRGTWCS